MQTEVFEYKIPTKIVYGINSRFKLEKEVKELNLNKVMLVTDKGVHGAGLLDDIEQQLKDAGVDYLIFDDIKFEPDTEIVQKGVKLCKDCDGIIGIGGGSPLDTAEAISVIASNGGCVKDYVGVSIYKKDPLPYIAIPTTAGTGSEATRWAIIKDKKQEVKLAIGCWQAMPEVSICDPVLTKSMPTHLTAATGMDALTHAIEAFVNVSCQNISEGMAIKSITLISHNLRQAVANGNNLEARDAMLMGSLTAALAFNVTGITSVHAISHVVGAHLDIPHGDANAVLLPRVMEFSLIGAPKRYAWLAEIMGEKVEGLTLMEKARKSVKAVDDLLSDIGFSHGLEDCGMSRKKLNAVANDKGHITRLAKEAAISSSNQLNPRQIKTEDIISILEKAL